ncbi:MAG TPA: glycosyltransferase [Aromatoleum sp.]|uniref:glycosyltransferase family 2 protein n=1 Tax=Aromatoleum sp. TaxID=2307007 RepID=UPI002B474326|nr:glycosyltransferase [Aromatoleum sp.]HJV26274.1 glycosyltransferase [Aromatoleum sp.]
MAPTVSIIMPCYNAVAHLPDSVRSVLAQTFADWELIAVDDGSSDATLAWLQAQTDARMRVIHQHNQGVSAARNAGLAQATGTYVAFLDADDTWHPDFLSRMHEALDARPEAVLAYCGWQNLGQTGGRGEPFVPPDYETPDKTEKLFAGCRWPIHAVLARRDTVQAARGFEPGLKNAEDFALWLEVAIPSPIVRVPAVLAYYHFHNGVQASNDRARAAIAHWRVQRRYLQRHPERFAHLSADRIRRLTDGELLLRGYESYWKRDIGTARQIFRVVMKERYGSPADWKHMLPALLPESLHRWLIRALAGDIAGVEK